MTKQSLTALDLYILTDTVLHSLTHGYWTGSATREGREQVLEKLQSIMNEMNMELTVQSGSQEDVLQ